MKIKRFTIDVVSSHPASAFINQLKSIVADHSHWSSVRFTDTSFDLGDVGPNMFKILREQEHDVDAFFKKENLATPKYPSTGLGTVIIKVPKEPITYKVYVIRMLDQGFENELVTKRQFDEITKDGFFNIVSMAVDFANFDADEVLDKLPTGSEFV